MRTRKTHNGKGKHTYQAIPSHKERKNNPPGPERQTPAREPGPKLGGGNEQAKEEQKQDKKRWETPTGKKHNGKGKHAHQATPPTRGGESNHQDPNNQRANHNTGRQPPPRPVAPKHETQKQNKRKQGKTNKQIEQLKTGGNQQ